MDYITFLGLLGYCMKGSEEEHFEFVQHNVSACAMNEGKSNGVCQVWQGGIEPPCMYFSFQCFF